MKCRRSDPAFPRRQALGVALLYRLKGGTQAGKKTGLRRVGNGTGLAEAGVDRLEVLIGLCGLGFQATQLRVTRKDFPPVALGQVCPWGTAIFHSSETPV